MKTYKVYWTEEAVTDLSEIIDYIAEDRPSAANKMYKNIKTKCRELNQFPHRCRRVPELISLGMQNYREVIHSVYRIVFKIDGNNICITAVVDGRRDFESFIFDRLLRE
ncbi:MAG: type II toxin-antitoxin system RelE/ParE family toxin [Deltaproteobacteria bacterium]|nr:type II toxin-antitoxin system RelE/ParE family toxin [Deltaproteobacteria bacterium]